MYTKTKGLVLRETNYKEGDKILTVLTPDLGKLTVKARGCRRKNSPLAASSQLLVYSELTLFTRSGYHQLSQAQSLTYFRGVTEDLELLCLGSYFAEVVEGVAQEGMEQEELLSLILNSLYALDKLKKPPRLVKAVFELALMALSGYAPMVESCAHCGVPMPEAPQLHLRNGLLHCGQCPGGEGGISMPLTTSALVAMTRVLYGDPKRLFSFDLDDQSLELLANCTEAYLLTQLERGFRTLEFYKQFTYMTTP